MFRYLSGSRAPPAAIALGRHRKKTLATQALTGGVGAGGSESVSQCGVSSLGLF